MPIRSDGLDEVFVLIVRGAVQNSEVLNRERTDRQRCEIEPVFFRQHVGSPERGLLRDGLNHSRSANPTAALS